MPPWPPPITRTSGSLSLPKPSTSAARRSFQVTRSLRAPCSTPLGRVVPWFSSWPLSSSSVVRNVQAPSSLSRSRPEPRPTAVSKRNQAVVTPPASSGSSPSVIRKFVASVVSIVFRSRSSTPSRFSTVVRFQLNAIRSRQNDVVANRPAARSASRAASAASKSASQVSTRRRAADGSAVVVGSRVCVMWWFLRSCTAAVRCCERGNINLSAKGTVAALLQP